MKNYKLHILLLVALSPIHELAANVKTDTIAKFEKAETLLKRNGKEQHVILSVGAVNPSQVATIKVVATQENSRKAVFLMPDLMLTVGKGFPDNYPVTVKLLPDSTENVIDHVRLDLYWVKSTGDSLLSHHDIYYQEFDPQHQERQFLRSTADIRNDINSLKAQLLDGDTSRTYIGKFIIKKSATIIPKGREVAGLVRDSIMKGEFQDNPSKKEKSKNIHNVVINVSEGLIDYIKVTMDDGSYFTNVDAPIHILGIQKRFDDELVNLASGEYILLRSAVDFISEKRFNFFPSSGTYHLNNNEKTPLNEYKVYANAGLNSFVDVRVFTDLLGTLDNQPNGLLQIEAKSKIFLHRENLQNKFMYMFYGLEPSINISKLDSKYDTIKLQDQLQKTINRMDLLQRSFLSVGMKLNMYRWDFRPSNSIYFNGGYVFHTGNISVRNAANSKDSIITKGTLHSPYFEFGLSSKRLNNFGFDGDIRYLLQKLNENKYFTNTGYNTLMNFAVTMFFYPGSKPKDKFFVRFSNFLNFDDRTEDFYQLQFGYSLNVKL